MGEARRTGAGAIVINPFDFNALYCNRTRIEGLRQTITFLKERKATFRETVKKPMGNVACKVRAGVVRRVMTIILLWNGDSYWYGNDSISGKKAKPLGFSHRRKRFAYQIKEDLEKLLFCGFKKLQIIIHKGFAFPTLLKI